MGALLKMRKCPKGIPLFANSMVSSPNPESTLCGGLLPVIVKLGRVRIDRLPKQVLQFGKIVLPERKRRSHGPTAKGL
jgi:hypothetical protein